ncbi:hypothetical protein MASR2M79_14960 [Aminivibrio sp.]
MPLVGTSPLRVDALEKACGEALYLDDLPLQGFWYGGAVRSSIPRGKIRGFLKDPSFDWTRVAVVTLRIFGDQRRRHDPGGLSRPPGGGHLLCDPGSGPHRRP